jgi:hypothetical protein
MTRVAGVFDNNGCCCSCIRMGNISLLSTQPYSQKWFAPTDIESGVPVPVLQDLVCPPGLFTHDGVKGFFFFIPFSVLLQFYPQFHVIQLVVTVLSHRCNSHTDSGEAKVESHASPETQPALLLDTTPTEHGSQPHQCVRGNTVHLATVSACIAPGPPQESLVRDGTKPPLTRTILGQLCAVPVVAGYDRSWTLTRILSGTASTAMQCLIPLRHSGRSSV